MTPVDPQQALAEVAAHIRITHPDAVRIHVDYQPEGGAVRLVEVYDHHGQELTDPDDVDEFQDVLGDRLALLFHTHREPVHQDGHGDCHAITLPPDQDDPRTAALALALTTLAEQYPTDEAAAPAAALTLRGTDGRAHPVTLTPGQIDWLTALVMDEMATCRNAHAGESGHCAHCAGTGRTRAHREL